MATVELDARGCKCPVPVLKMNNAVMKKEVQAGDTLAVTADCPTFEADVREWCTRMKKVLVVLKDAGNGAKRAEVLI
ncbi:MAG TPA: sulfurtransferase TusA family protein [Candidatus Saccharimonadales bacterium]|nr:sulfurtransferase TusA family protein [Candidatus Saccharimonadales bacterium]